mgnify:CR=1 FL=1
MRDHSNFAAQITVNVTGVIVQMIGGGRGATLHIYEAVILMDGPPHHTA